jgi:hypothetical protein
MPNRISISISISALLKSVILAITFVVIAGFCLSAWDSWGRLQATNRITMVVESSGNLFKAMHSMRGDRTSTNRTLNSEGPAGPDIEKFLRDLRETETVSFNRALILLPALQFQQQSVLVPELDRLFKRLSAEQKEYWEEMAKPKASRRLALGKEYLETTQSLLDTADSLSENLTASINHEDATVDQLLMVKQMAWLLRNMAGDAATIVSNGLAAGRVSPENQLAYTKDVGGAEAVWTALGLAASGMQLPPVLSDAMKAVKTGYFEPAFIELRDRQFSLLVKGEKADMTANQWGPMAVERLGSAVNVAEIALDMAKDHADAQRRRSGL